MGTLRRRHTLPLLPELIVSSASIQSFSSAFEDFPNFFTSDATQHQPCHNQSAPIPHHSSVEEEFQPQHSTCINSNSSPGTARVRTRRAKSIEFTTAKERPKLISIPRRQRPVTFSGAPTLDIDAADSKELLFASGLATITSQSHPPTANIMCEATADGTIDLNKQLPSLPRRLQNVNAIKKRLSRIFRFDSQDCAASSGLDLDVLAVEKVPPAASGERNGIVGKKIKLWEGLAASLSRQSESVKAEEFTERTGATSTQISAYSSSTDVDETPNWRRSNSYLSYASEAHSGSDLTVIVRPDLASESFENFTLISRPSTPVRHLQYPTPTTNRLVRSPRCANLRLEAMAASPVASGSYCRRRRARTGTWYGTAPPSNPTDEHSQSFEQHDWLASQSLIDGGYEPVTPPKLKRNASFHMNYFDFMDESLHRYGRSGFGGRMIREVPVSESMQPITDDQESRVDPNTEKMLEIWADVEITPGGTVIC